VDEYNWNVGFQGGMWAAPIKQYLFNIGGAGRYYDPQTGRWGKPDNGGYVDGLNLYRSFDNNPVSRVDPSGMNPGECTLTSIVNLGPWTFRGIYPGTLTGLSTNIGGGITADGVYLRAVYTRLVQYLWVACDCTDHKYYVWGPPQAQKGWYESLNPANTTNAISGSLPISLPLPYGQSMKLNITYGRVWLPNSNITGMAFPAIPTNQDPMPIPEPPPGKTPVQALTCGNWSQGGNFAKKRPAPWKLP